MTKQEILDLTISFKAIRLIRIDLPQKEVFVSGIGIRKSREALLLEWEDQDGVKGYGECSCRPDPYYSDEFIEGGIALVKQFVVPFLSKEQSFGDLLRLLDKIRGWNFTKAAVEMAALQVIEKNTGKSPFDLMKGEPLAEVPVGISMGLYTDLDHMKKVVKNALDTGYRRLKFKISPNVRTDFFDAVNPMMFAADTFISFDANGSFGEDDLDTFGYFVDTYKTMVEQPFAPGRYDVLLKGKKEYPALFACFDEEIKSIGDLIKLHHLGVLDEVNLKVGRVGGVMKSIEIIDYCAEHNIPCWIGGMFETGIGRTLNLRMASYLPDARAHDLSPSDRYFLEDIIQPNVQMNNGRVDMESLKNCEINPELIDKYTIDQHLFTL
jgi:O-succinylbenzoate synthase